MKRAYHDILLPDGTLQHGPVIVETDAEGQYLGWRRLREEEALTEWIGGTFTLADSCQKEKKVI